MKPHDRPSALDIAAVILSPAIVAVLTVIFLLGWWVVAVWGWARGEDN